jgi:hypothetical protein
MAVWELWRVALLVGVLLAACWALNAWNRDQFWPRFLRRGAPPRCPATKRSLSTRGRRPFSLRPLPLELRTYYAGVCERTAAGFSASPRAAVHDLDLLVAEVLRQCGFPVEAFEHNVAKILPAAPQVVEDYRTAHVIALANDSGIASEPDLRLAMFHYHELFKMLLEDDGPQPLSKSQR